MKEKGKLIADGPSYLLHHNDPDFWWEVKMTAAKSKLSVKDFIILVLKEKVKEKNEKK